MFHPLKLLILFICFFPAVLFAQQKITNPILPGYFADPTIIQENGQDYILYHRIFPQQKDYVLRQLCVDSLKFDEQGNIRPVIPKGITSFSK